jgi:hypothetical protein
MGLLNKIRVYLCGSMQYTVDGRSWREKVTKELTKINITVFNPYIKPFACTVLENEQTREELMGLMAQENYEEIAKRMKPVRNYDLRLCDISDFLVAHITPQIASWGSAEELTTVCRQKKPVFISVEGGKKCTPLWLLAMFPHECFYNSVDEIIVELKKIDSGEQPMDNSRWRLLREEFR